MRKFIEVKERKFLNDIIKLKKLSSQSNELHKFLAQLTVAATYGFAFFRYINFCEIEKFREKVCEMQTKIFT